MTTSYPVGGASAPTAPTEKPSGDHSRSQKSLIVLPSCRCKLLPMTTRCAHGYHQLRVGRHSLCGQLYLLTTVTHQRKPYFADINLARLAARSLSLAEHWLASRCLCWVLMPDHWHGLVELGDGANLSATMQHVKGVTARVAGLHDEHA